MIPNPDTAMNTRSMVLALVWIAASVASRAPAVADDLFRFNDDLGTSVTTSRHLLICCGLPGDEQHREQMTEACQSIITSSRDLLGVAEEDLVVLAGDEQMQAELQSTHSGTQICTRDSIEQSLDQFAKSVGPADAFWLLMIGHSHPYGAESQFNISGKDINQSEFAKMANLIDCREQVFWFTQPLSGFWIKPLARPGRIIVSATEADLEFTGTEMPYALAAVMSGSAENQNLEDVDGDSTISLLDLYLATNIEITLRFRAIDRLQTEHAQLDDNGDGRGSEVQAPYLPADPEEEEEASEEEEESDDEDASDEDKAEDETALKPEVQPKPPLIQSRNLDGFLSRYILLSKSVATEASDGTAE